MRPRSRSGAASCSAAWQPATTITEIQPRTNRTPAATPNRPIVDMTTRPVHDRKPVVNRSDIDGACSAPSVSAPPTAPTPTAAMSRPKPSGPRPSTWRAKSGT